MDLKVNPWRNPVLVDMLDLCHQRVYLLTYSYWQRERNQCQDFSKALVYLCLLGGWQKLMRTVQKRWGSSPTREREGCNSEVTHSIPLMLHLSPLHFYRCLSCCAERQLDLGKRLCNPGALKRDFFSLCKTLKNVDL